MKSVSADVPWSEREVRIVALVNRGLTNPQIARSLGMSLNGVKCALQRLYHETGLHDRVDLAYEAELRGYLSTVNRVEEPAAERQRLVTLLDGVLASAPAQRKRLEELASRGVARVCQVDWVTDAINLLERSRALLEAVDGLE